MVDEVKKTRAMLAFMSGNELARYTGIQTSTLKRVELGAIPKNAVSDKINAAWVKFLDEKQGESK